MTLDTRKEGYLPAIEFTMRFEPLPAPTPTTSPIIPSPTITLPVLPTPSLTDEIPPLIILKELHPRYFVVGDDERYKVEALVIDNVGVKSVLFLKRRFHIQDCISLIFLLKLQEPS